MRGVRKSRFLPDVLFGWPQTRCGRVWEWKKLTEHLLCIVTGEETSFKNQKWGEEFFSIRNWGQKLYGVFLFCTKILGTMEEHGGRYFSQNETIGGVGDFLGQISLYQVHVVANFAPSLKRPFLLPVVGWL